MDLSAADVAALDDSCAHAGLRSRSAAVQRAIRLLPNPGPEADYAAAWAEWGSSGEAAAWEVTVGDGLTDTLR